MYRRVDLVSHATPIGRGRLRLPADCSVGQGLARRPCGGPCRRRSRWRGPALSLPNAFSTYGDRAAASPRHLSPLHSRAARRSAVCWETGKRLGPLLSPCANSEGLAEKSPDRKRTRREPPTRPASGGSPSLSEHCRSDVASCASGAFAPDGSCRRPPASAARSSPSAAGMAPRFSADSGLCLLRSRAGERGLQRPYRVC